MIPLTRDDCGVVIDENRGWRGIGYVVEEAIAWGFEPTDDDREVIRSFFDDDDSPAGWNMPDLSDEAEQWLNDHVAPDGCSFGWHDGSFFLQTTEWWSEI
jgi:hypothetical protein